jgi:hypothetical protein
LLEKLFFRQSVKYLQEKQFWLGEVHGETEEKKVLLLFEKEFLSLSLSKFRKLEEKVVEIFDP